MHTLSFDESNVWQKKWALYSACRSAELITAQLGRSSDLTIDWLDEQLAAGQLGLSPLPGRRDLNRNVREDLATLKAEGVTRIICLLSHPEFADYGVDDLLDRYRETGLEYWHLPIPDQAVSSSAQMQAALSWLDTQLSTGHRVVVHCVGGLGRSGTLAACHLKSRGLSVEDAMTEVRRARSPRAIESEAQELFILEFEA